MRVFPKALTSINKIITKTSELESEGRYSEALETLKTAWEDYTKVPETKNLSKVEIAELFLMCGSLLSYLDPYKHLTKEQDVFEQLMEKAEKLFREQKRAEKLIECQIIRTLASFYANKLIQARKSLNELQKINFGEKVSCQLFGFIIETWLDLEEKKFEEITVKSKEKEEVFRQFGNDILKGCFQNNLGIAKMELEDYQEAEICFEEALGYFEKAGHQLYAGEVYINWATLNSRCQEFEKAILQAEISKEKFVSIKDEVNEAKALCLRSTFYFEQKDFGNALLDIDDAIRLFLKKGSYKFLLQAYLVKTNTLINLRRFYESFKVMTEAHQISSAYLNEEAVKSIPEEMGKQLESLFNPMQPSLTRKITLKRSYVVNDIKIESFHLVLPPSLSTEIDYFTVEIEDFSLVKFGLKKGVLAVIAAEKVKSQDLIVLFEEGKEEVVFGIYEEDLKLVVVNVNENESVFYAEEDVRILGKVVGFCYPPVHFNEELEVKLL